MKKVSLFAAAFAFVGFMSVSCQNAETPAEKVEDGMEEVGEGIEEGAEDVGEEVEETVEDAGDNMEAAGEEMTEEAAH
jgi:enamine deaminase RidA (YjgF/YER057c/UK114 family)